MEYVLIGEPRNYPSILQIQTLLLFLESQWLSLLQQITLNTTEFKWSKNLLDTTARQFAFYIFNDGFGYVTPAGAITFDNVSKKIIYKDKGVTDEQLNIGKAYMQLSFEDFLKR